MTSDLLAFFAFLEGHVDTLGWGTISGNVVLVNGRPKMETLSIVKSKRLKFTPDPTLIIENFEIHI